MCGTGVSPVNYTWDAENRLGRVQSGDPNSPANGDEKVEFVYDFLGRRVEKKVSTHNGTSWSVSDRRRFVWSDWLVVLELDASDPNDVTILRKYTWGLDLSGNNLLDPTNANESGPYAADNSFRFSTKYWDDETGLGYWGYRLEEGHHPGALQMLVPRFLDSVPQDPFDGQHLRYSESNGAVRIWSVGPNMIDDGGSFDIRLDPADKLDVGIQLSAPCVDSMNEP